MNWTSGASLLAGSFPSSAKKASLPFLSLCFDPLPSSGVKAGTAIT